MTRPDYIVATETPPLPISGAHAADAIGIGLIGAGGISRSHLNAITAIPQLARLVAVADVGLARAQRAASEYGAVPAYADWRRLLDDPAVEAVAICTPPYSHASIAAEALAAGRHVLSEKPVAGTLAAIDALIETAAHAGRVCTGVFQLRYGQGARQVRALLDAGLFGRLTLGLCETLWLRQAEYFSGDWRGTYAGDFGGVATIQAIHTIDLLRSLMGEVESVYAEADTLVHGIEVEDTLVAMLRFASGAIGQVTATINAQDNRSRVELFGTRLQAVSSESAYNCTAFPFRLSATDSDLLAAAELLSSTQLHEGVLNLHQSLYMDFCGAIRTGCEPLVTLRDARQTLEVITAIYKSSATRTRVTLPIAENDPWYRGVPAVTATGLNRP